MPNPLFMNVFPDLLSFGALAPFILRIVIGFLFIDLGLLKFKGEKSRWLATFNAVGLRPADTLLTIYGALQVVGGALLIIGLWTQAAALVFVIFTGTELYLEWKERTILKRDIVFYILTCAISLSILLSGAGAFALDLPL